MRPSRIIDLSEALYHNCPGNPAFPPCELSTKMLHAVSGWCAEELRLFTHLGTHVDAPYHRFPTGARLDEIPLERLVCQAVCIAADKAGAGAPIGVEVLAEYAGGVEPGSALLLRTGWGDRRANTEEYLYRSPWLSREAAEWVVARGLVGVGIDHFSIGGAQPQNVTIPHDILLIAGLWIAEGLCIPPELTRLGPFLLVVAPLALTGASGAPARVLALID